MLPHFRLDDPPGAVDDLPDEVAVREVHPLKIAKISIFAVLAAAFAACVWIRLGRGFSADQRGWAGTGMLSIVGGIAGFFAGRATRRWTSS